MDFLLLLQATPDSAIPISGFALCFFPLAAVIIGFIVAARFTDRQATSTYLRVLPASEAPADLGSAMRSDAAVLGTVRPGTPPGQATASAVTVATKPAPKPMPPVETKPGISVNPPPAGTPPTPGVAHATDTPPAAPTPPLAAQPTPDFASAQPPVGPAESTTAPPPSPIPDVPVQTGTPPEPDRPLMGISERDRPLSEPPPANPTREDMIPRIPPEPTTPQGDPHDDRSVAPENVFTPEPPAAAGTTPGLAITHVEWNPAGSDLEGEYVQIDNHSPAPIDMTGWQLSDIGSKHMFTFPAFEFPAGGRVRIWSKAGTPDASNLYMGSRGAVWNNTGDTAVLRDANGTEISRWSYEGRPDK